MCIDPYQIQTMDVVNHLYDKSADEKLQEPDFNRLLKHTSELVNFRTILRGMKNYIHILTLQTTAKPQDGSSIPARDSSNPECQININLVELVKIDKFIATCQQVATNLSISSSCNKSVYQKTTTKLTF